MQKADHKHGLLLCTRKIFKFCSYSTNLGWQVGGLNQSFNKGIEYGRNFIHILLGMCCFEILLIGVKKMHFNEHSRSCFILQIVAQY